MEELTRKTIEREELALSLRDVTDFERAMTRIATGACSCRDLASLAQGAQALPEIRKLLGGMDASLLAVLHEQLDRSRISPSAFPPPSWTNRRCSCAKAA